MKRLVVIAGSGRSGTSVMTAIMGQLGLYVPQPEVQPDETNPQGFGEPQWVVDFHNKLLRSVNVHMSDARPSAWALAAKASLDEANFAELRAWLAEQFATSDRVIVKDPRLLWFLPLWERVGTFLDGQVDVVTMLRHPAEAVRSKRTLSEANRLAGWVNTMLLTERATRDRRRVFVQFEELLDDWTQQIGRISTALELPSLVTAKAENQMKADELIDRSLLRTKASWQDLGAPKELVGLADHIWTELLLLANEEQAVEATERLDRHRERFVALYEHAEAIAESSMLAEVRPLKQQVNQLRREKQKVEARSAQGRRAANAAGGSAPSGSPNGVLARAVRLVPAGVRKRVPLRVRQKILRPSHR